MQPLLLALHCAIAVIFPIPFVGHGTYVLHRGSEYEFYYTEYGLCAFILVWALWNQGLFYT